MALDSLTSRLAPQGFGLPQPAFQPINPWLTGQQPPQTGGNPLAPTPQPYMNPTAQPFDQSTIRAFLQASHEQNQTQLAIEKMRGENMQQLNMAPPSRHLGMDGQPVPAAQPGWSGSGADVGFQSVAQIAHDQQHGSDLGGAYRFGGFGASPASMGMAQQQQNAWAGANDFDRQRTGAETMLPSTQALVQPGPPIPQGGFSAPQWPAHVQAVQQQLANTQAAIARTRGMYPQM